MLPRRELNDHCDFLSYRMCVRVCVCVRMIALKLKYKMVQAVFYWFGNTMPFKWYQLTYKYIYDLITVIYFSPVCQ